MGLREDAEAARLQSIAEKEEAALDKAEQERRREQQRRYEEEEMARDVALNVLGIDDFSDLVWVNEGPVSEGYPDRVYLHLRTEDGVWLRYFQTIDHLRRNVTLHRWMVAQKCPIDDHWVMPGGWAETLAQIGQQLSDAPETLQKHLRQNHPEAIAA